MTNQKPIPPSLPQIGELGENIYDPGKASDWAVAADKLTALKGAVIRLTHELTATSADVDRLNERVIAMTAKDRQAVSHAANQVTLLVANLTEPFVIYLSITKHDVIKEEPAAETS